MDSLQGITAADFETSHLEREAKKLEERVDTLEKRLLAIEKRLSTNDVGGFGLNENGGQQHGGGQQREAHPDDGETVQTV